MKRTKCLFYIVLVCALSIPSVAQTQADALTYFITCITSASGPEWSSTTQTCTLEYYPTPYLISSTLQVYSSSVLYISTGSAGVAQTWPMATLQRDTSSITSMTSPFDILFADGSTANGLLIENLIIDGNRAGLNSSSQQPINCLGPAWIDVDLTHASYTSGMQYSGANVYDVTFNNSPGVALDLSPWSYVYWSIFQYPRISAVYTSPDSVVDDNTMEYSGTGPISIVGQDTLVEYNTLTSNHDEWDFNAPGGQIYIGDTGPTSYTVLSNMVDGGSLACPGSGCTYNNSLGEYTANSSGCPIVGFSGTSTLGTYGIEVHTPGGTFNNNEIENHTSHGVQITDVDGALASPSVPSITWLTNDPDWTEQWIESNALNGIQISQSSGTVGGAWSFTDLISQNNGEYGFAWSGSIAAGTSISWGTGNSACLLPNGPHPYTQAYDMTTTGLSGPGSTNTSCP